MEHPTPLMLTPGPVRVPDYVMEAISRPPIHQRTSAFEEFLMEMQAGLQYLFQTSGRVLCMPGSGTSGVEATMRSLFGPGSQVAIQDTGKFSGRWVEYGRSLGLDVVVVQAAWGQTIGVEQVRQVLTDHPKLEGWVLTHVETSTGMAVDLEEIAFAIREAAPEQLIVVDGICSVGIQALYQDAWELDAVVAASQKGLANPAGTCLVGLSLRAIDRLRPSGNHDAFHLRAFFNYLERGSYPFTPPVQLMYGLAATVARLQEEGLPHRWNAIQALQRDFQNRVQAQGGILAGPGAGFGLSVFHFPNRDNNRIRLQLQTDHHLLVANGQGALKGKVMRVGHFGDVGPREMDALTRALTHILATQEV